MPHLRQRPCPARRLFLLTTALGGGFAALPDATAQTAWPGDKPINIVVPYPPGGSSDVIARLLGRKLSDALKVPVIVDNKAGAATFVATDAVRRSSADGHTLLLVDVPFAITPHVLPSANYDLRQFTAVALVGTAAQVFWAEGGKGRTLAQLVEQAKAKPGEVPMASGGAGTNVHLLLEAFQKQAGIKINHVPYKGSVPMLTDIGAGVVAAGFSSLASGKPLMDFGRISPLAVTSPVRDPALPQVPTFAELGYPGMTGEHWWGLVGPAQMKGEAASRLHREVVAALAAPEIRQQLQSLAITPRPGSAADFGKLLGQEFEIWGALARQANVRME